MKNQAPNSSLNFCCDGMGYRPSREYRHRILHPVDINIKPVFGRTTVFSIPHAALAAGLLDIPKSCVLSWGALKGVVKARWERSSESFLRDAANAGVTMDRVHMAAATLPPGLIGWSDRKDIKAGAESFGLCSDLALTLAVLSRRAGNLILRSREPIFSWPGLFSVMFEVDEQIDEAPCLRDEPWSRFQWEEDVEVSHECTI